jgi:microcystin-dependent protein
MASITPKLFNAAEKIYRTIFKGKPSIFSVEDLNRQLDAIYYANNIVSRHLGPIRNNWVFTAQTTFNSTTNTLTVTSAAVSTVNVALTATIHYKGVSFDVPPSSFSNIVQVGQTSSATLLPSLSLFLIAKPTLVDFATNNVLSGLTSTDYPGALPAADNIVYGNERLVLANDPQNVTLAQGEEIIGVIASIVPTELVDNSGNINTNYVIRYNASTVQELCILAGGLQLSQSNTLGNFTFADNRSIIDWAHYLMDYLKFELSNINYVLSNLNTLVTQLGTAVTALQNNFTQLSNTVTTLQSTVNQHSSTLQTLQTSTTTNNTSITTLTQQVQALITIPVGGIIMWGGGLSAFNNTGAGIGVLANFHLCNGSAGTPDLRGKFAVGYDPNDSDYNTVSASGGSKDVTLTINQMPQHSHSLRTQAGTTPNNTINYVGSGGNKDISVGAAWKDDQQLTVQDAGNNQPHENRPPYRVVVYIMRIT